ncbi:hypothetical protein NDU88_004411 [Pleurodeles waltl]|uniref:Uncharacterized protein n=1 Tax=Pleurodeles waltl TaxID=8319 RepID=A0AAV7PJQ9_PLEWA|nr:hypothetical protein NDU88_004411 [Pleurodeles waltl]
MEPNKVVMALKVLQVEGREDLIKEGVLEEAWVGLKRPKRRSAGGVSAAVAACSSPKLGKKFKAKSVQGRKVSSSPELEVVDLSVPQGSSVLSRGRQGVSLPRRQGLSLLRRVYASGRGVPLKPPVVRAGRMGARQKGARARLRSQTRSPLERGVKRGVTDNEERQLAGASKMAPPRDLVQLMPASIEIKAGKSVRVSAPGVQVSKEVVIISDEDEDGQEGAGSVLDLDLSDRWGFQGQKYNRCMQWIPRAVSPMLHRVQSWEVGNQVAVNLGEQIELVDGSGSVFKGTVCGEAGSSGALGRAYVSLDFWEHDRCEGATGCDTSHVLGGRGVLAIYRQSGWIVGDQRLPVWVRAPSEHRYEGRVRSGAVHPTSWKRDGPDEAQPSTSQGAGAGCVSLDEELLDYDDDPEVPASVMKQAVVAEEMPGVVQGGHVPAHQQEFAGNLPKGEEGFVGPLRSHKGRDSFGDSGRAKVSKATSGARVLGNTVDASIQVSEITELVSKSGVSGSTGDGVLEKDESDAGRKKLDANTGGKEVVSGIKSKKLPYM